MEKRELSRKEGQRFMEDLNHVQSSVLGKPVNIRTAQRHYDDMMGVFKKYGHGLENIKMHAIITPDDQIQLVGLDEMSNFALLGISLTLTQYNEQR